MKYEQKFYLAVLSTICTVLATYESNLYSEITKMKIEEVKSTVKTQRISAHTHIKG
jgi:hypothetical protein